MDASPQSTQEGLEGVRLYPVAMQWLGWILVSALCFSIVTYFYNLTLLFMVCVTVTYILLGPVNGLEWIIHWIFQRVMGPLTKRRRRLSRWLAVSLVYLLFWTLVIGSGVTLAPVLSAQVQSFAKTVPQYGEAIEHWLNEQWGIQWGDVIPVILPEAEQSASHKEPLVNGSALNPLSNSVAQPLPSLNADATAIRPSSGNASFFQQLLMMMETSVSEGLNHIGEILTGTLRGVFYVVSGLVLVFYFLLDGPQLIQWLIPRLPAHWHQRTEQLLNSAHQVMGTFIKGQFFLGLVTGAYMFTVYSIFGVPYAFLLGAFFAVSEILPVVGTWIGITPGFLVILLSDNPSVIIWVWLCSYVYQTLKDNVVAPKVVGDVMGLHPVIVIMALLTGVKLAGFVGILVALPLASILSIILDRCQQEADTVIAGDLSPSRALAQTAEEAS